MSSTPEGGLLKPTIVAIPPEDTSVPESPSADRTVATLSSPWEFDVSQPYCAGCSNLFTPVNRRHHCRLCGKIYCNKCSQWKALIPPSSIVLVPRAGKKAKPGDQSLANISFQPDDDPDRMLTTYEQGDGGDGDQHVLYGRGLEERFLLAREPLRVCHGCYAQLEPMQEELRNSNSNAMRFNHIDPTDVRRMFNSPLAFTLGHEVRKAAYTLNNLLPLPKRMGAFVPTSVEGLSGGDGSTNQQNACQETCNGVSPSLGDLDGVRIPARLLEEAKGVAVMTVVKGGFGLAGIEFGTGLVVARLGERWSAPSAIGTAGLSWGALVGAQVSDHVFLLMTDAAVEMLFAANGSVQLGADVGVALGPLGRAFEADFGAAVGSVAPIYTYSLSKGLYAGVSLDGKVIVTRHNVNEKFYGKHVTAGEFLSGTVPAVPAAQPLYDALSRCSYYATGSHGRVDFIRNSAMQNRNNTMMAHQQSDAGEYGELLPQQQTTMPPANNDEHSYTGLSDLTSDPVYRS